MIKSYRDLQVWQSGMDFAAECYRLARLMPKAEEFRITSQLLRAAASVPANVAEGWMRASRKDYARFVSIARASLAEAETFLLLSVRTGLLGERETVPAMATADTLGRQLNVLWNQLANPKPQTPKPKPIGTAQPDH
jgi:four helix bundle protein